MFGNPPIHPPGEGTPSANLPPPLPCSHITPPTFIAVDSHSTGELSLWSPPSALLPVPLRAGLAPGEPVTRACPCSRTPSVRTADPCFLPEQSCSPRACEESTPAPSKRKKHMTETIHTTPMMQAIDAASRTGAKKFRSKKQPQEWGLTSLRECPLPSDMLDCTPSLRTDALVPRAKPPSTRARPRQADQPTAPHVRPTPGAGPGCDCPRGRPGQPSGRSGCHGSGDPGRCPR